jgi:hypothetical protein
MAQQMMQRDERSIGELFSELAGETSTLVRQEMALAQAEMTRKATKAGKNVGYLAIGGAVGYAGLLAIIAGVIMGLSYLMPAWIAALLVGVVIAIASYLLISSGLAALKNMDPKPTETVETIKEDARWLKNQVT